MEYLISTGIAFALVAGLAALARNSCRDKPTQTSVLQSNRDNTGDLNAQPMEKLSADKVAAPIAPPPETGRTANSVSA